MTVGVGDWLNRCFWWGRVILYLFFGIQEMKKAFRWSGVRVGGGQTKSKCQMKFEKIRR